MSRPSFALLVAVVTLACCGTSAPKMHGRSAANVGWRMRHQILYSRDGQDQVFDGYMIRAGDAFLVKAFAGPGVELFTVVRNGEAHREELHIPGLQGKIDMAAVGEDIALVYQGGCARPRGAGSAECSLLGESMVETYDATGDLVERRFPKAHGIGLAISYEDYGERSGARLAGKVTLRWGEGKSTMVIRLLSNEPMPDFDRRLLEVR
ncbi:MAG: hypothetical protein PHU25_09455 [Deltaproteobacteria bacterium]|nr:hypothetical protein [Deltaproteobacteria bacterium]